MENSLIITVPRTMTAPPAGAPKLRVPGEMINITSDTFSSGSAMSGRVTDAARGGAPFPYETSASDVFAISGGQLVRSASTSTGHPVALVALPTTRSKDVKASATVAALPTKDAGAGIIVRRDKLNSYQSMVRAQINSNTVSLNVYINGVSTVPVVGVALSAGDTVGVREYNGLVELSVNGVVVGSATYPPGTFVGDYAGLMALSSAGAFGFDNFIVTETTR